MMFDVPVVGKVGDNLTSNFHGFGKLDGHGTTPGPAVFCSCST